MNAIVKLLVVLMASTAYAASVPTPYKYCRRSATGAVAQPKLHTHGGLATSGMFAAVEEVVTRVLLGKDKKDKKAKKAQKAKAKKEKMRALKKKLKKATRKCKKQCKEQKGPARKKCVKKCVKAAVKNSSNNAAIQELPGYYMAVQGGPPGYYAFVQEVIMSPTPGGYRK